jgi:putative flippase GtrA
LRIVRFALVGVVNTFVGLGIVFAMKWAFGLGDAISNLIGYAVGLAVSFSLNRSWTFRFRGASAGALWRFGWVVFAAYCVNLSLVLAAVRWFGVDGYLAQTLGVVPYSALTYIGCKYWVFVPAPGSAGTQSQKT